MGRRVWINTCGARGRVYRRKEMEGRGGGIEGGKRERGRGGGIEGGEEG